MIDSSTVAYIIGVMTGVGIAVIIWVSSKVFTDRVQEDVRG